ncbi:MAG TPA: hypothetical protein VIW47_08280 [Nitrospiraceae bacterium]|jgi:hypothetical protein
MDDANRKKLKVLMVLFGLKPSAIARAGKVSRAYISRLLHDPTFRASDQFYNAIESKLAALVASRPQRVFDTPATAPTQLMEDYLSKAECQSQ